MSLLEALYQDNPGICVNEDFERKQARGEETLAALTKILTTYNMQMMLKKKVGFKPGHKLAAKKVIRQNVDPEYRQERHTTASIKNNTKVVLEEEDDGFNQTEAVSDSD